MKGKKFAVAASLICALISPLGTPQKVQAQGDKTSYPKMAPLSNTLWTAMLKLLWREARPRNLYPVTQRLSSWGARYETAVEGKNGFVCNVERSWMSPFDGSEFWNPKVRGALCYNPQAARSVLPITYLRTKIVLAGLPGEEMIDRIKVAYAKKELPSLEHGSMCYMMSKQSYLTDNGSHNMAHLMLTFRSLTVRVGVRTCPTLPSTSFQCSRARQNRLTCSWC